ncbi:AroM family protein [Salipiger sp. P9]|uniref:AroM family protein n=1 Tax=Salipiger pentaromativorans TaxID=2943193 RepID=UPI00215765B9|nr:AroM family protein [Salipiger pentaromativorans]MCR8546918.1 AroM family protein [Salipiger pentaromativorans]
MLDRTPKPASAPETAPLGRKLGTITPGQAPRADLTPILEAALPEGVALIQKGVLDGLSAEEIAAGFAPAPGAPVIISRLLDGASAVMDKHKVEANIQRLVTELEDAGCTTILLLCTGKFEALHTRSARLVEPQKVLLPSLAALTQGLRVGLLVPLPEQIDSEGGKFAAFDTPPIAAAVSPYEPANDALAETARALAEAGAEILMTDCMGFVEHHRDTARAASGLPVVLSSALIAKLVAEIV